MGKSKHIWDYPEDMHCAMCKECGIRRYKEKYLGRFLWVYYRNGSGMPIWKSPKCIKIQIDNK